MHNSESKKEFAIPGLQGPADHPNSDERSFTDAFGTLNTPVYGPVPFEDPTPRFNTIISNSDSHQCNEIMFEDPIGKNIIKVNLGNGMAEYRLKINYKDCDLLHGNWRIMVCANEKVVHKGWVVIEDSCKFGIIPADELEFAELVPDRGQVLCGRSDAYMTLEAIGIGTKQ